ncbi:MAG TPA: PRC-barrel domain-containing protein [Xanthobacteraceae bacterium]|nr:MAG: photosystem reaction center subunit H [Azorhizobium sp. 12-66-6]HQS09446.1 PRC-barrel domain-containing protein [Xanthobacteraceae bacterium]HQS49724.1 PRC-barrel domain-containing protein [Xanthobacteraceae bacterium]
MRKILLAMTAVSMIAAPVGAVMAQNAVAVQSDTFVSAKPTDVLSYNLVGLKVMNGEKETVGEIKDLILSKGELEGYIVSVGGFLGMGERYVIVRPNAVQIAYSEADKKWSAMMNATKDQLKAAPEFKYEGRWKS